MVSEQHPVPMAIDGMLALLRAAAVEGQPLSGVRIEDGMPSGDKAHREVITVGTVATGTVATGSTTRTLGHRDESCDFACLIEVSGGSRDVSRSRSRAYRLLQHMHDLLERNRQLDGAVFAAEVIRHNYQVESSTSGVRARIEAAVHVRAFRRRFAE